MGDVSLQGECLWSSFVLGEAPSPGTRAAMSFVFREGTSSMALVVNSFLKCPTLAGRAGLRGVSFPILSLGSCVCS